MFLLRAVGMMALGVVPWTVLSAQTSAAVARRAGADTGAASGDGVVTGVVFDSVALAPLRGAVVQMRLETGSRRVYSAVTDSSGTYRMEGVQPGSYLGGFFHPALDRLGLQPIARRVTIGDDAVTRVDYAIPSPTVIWATACPAASPRDSSGLLLGRVHDADTDRPLAGGIVAVTWTELVIEQRGMRRERRQLVARSTENGSYALCGVPTDVAVLARAGFGGVSSGYVQLRVPPRGLLQRDFGIGMPDSAAVTAASSTDRTATAIDTGVVVHRGTARLDGTVRAPSGEPLADVQLLVRGSTARGTTDAQGHVTLVDLPAGTFTLEARLLGFAPTRVIVDLASHRTTTVTVTLDKKVPVLSEVHVYGKGVDQRDLTGFLERRKHGFGHFFTREDIEKQHAFAISDLFRTIPGVQVVPMAGGFGHKVLIRAALAPFTGCNPVVYVDGMRMYLEPGFDLDSVVALESIVGIEVYEGPSESPPQYRGEGCGVVVIWTGA